MIRKGRKEKRASSGSLAKQLTAYSVAAGAALTMSPQAESAIHVFHPAEPLKVDISQTVNIDMDMDGIADFSFYAYAGMGCWGLHIYRSDAANRFDGTESWARNVGIGEKVNPTRDIEGAFLEGCCHFTVPPWCGGNFNGANGYIGVKFRGHGGRDYDGWIHFNGDNDTIDGWAYEDSGGPIKAGDEVNTSIALTYLSDLNANKRKEIAVLQKTTSGNDVSSSIEIKDVSTRQTISIFPCLAPSFTPMGLDHIKDSKGKTTKIAVLGVSGNEPDSRIVRVQVIESATALPLKDIFFDNQYTPKDFAILNDRNGNGFREIAVLGENTATGLARIEIRDSASGDVIKTIVVGRSKDLSSVSLTPLPDQNSNGVSEIAVLQVNTVTKVNNVIIVDGQTGKKLKTIRCLKGYAPSAVRWTSDLNKNSVPEISVLGVHPVTKAVRVEIVDPLTKEIVKTVFFNKTFSPMDLATGDMNNDTYSELSLLEVNQDTGKSQIEIRDALTGKAIKTITLP